MSSLTIINNFHQHPVCCPWFLSSPLITEILLKRSSQLCFLSLQLVKDNRWKATHAFMSISFSNAVTCDICDRSLAQKPALQCQSKFAELWGPFPWWCHQMETFPMLLALCEGNSLVSSEFLAQRPVTRSFDVFYDLPLNKRVEQTIVRLVI